MTYSPAPPMSAEQRVKKFEDWSREHGRSSRESDRRRVALELFDISHGKRVEPEHVDALAKKYRDGLMGANAILHARAVADDLLAWQEEAGGDADEASSSFAPPPRAVSERPQRHADLPPAKASSIAPPGRSERPPAWQDAALGRHESTPLSRSDVPPRGDRREARRSSEPGAPPPYGISQVARSTAPERKYSEPPAKGRGVASLDSLPPAKPASDDLFDDVDLPEEGVPERVVGRRSGHLHQQVPEPPQAPPFRLDAGGMLPAKTPGPTRRPRIHPRQERPSGGARIDARPGLRLESRLLTRRTVKGIHLRSPPAGMPGIGIDLPHVPHRPEIHRQPAAIGAGREEETGRRSVLVPREPPIGQHRQGTRVRIPTTRHTARSLGVSADAHSPM